jgi:hypothetical protein
MVFRYKIICYFVIDRITSQGSSIKRRKNDDYSVVRGGDIFRSSKSSLVVRYREGLSRAAVMR